MSMTTEQAITWLEDYIDDSYDEISYPPDMPHDLADYLLNALRAQQERERPRALTLEQLAGMHGEPIYIVELDAIPDNRWELLDLDIPVDWESQDVNLQSGNAYATYDYGKTFVAYDRPPKEDAPSCGSEGRGVKEDADVD